jgi:hypothetical protein
MDVKELIEKHDLNILFLCKFGSHLYGTNTPESDEDFKGVYLPTLEQCIIGDVPRTVSYYSGKDDSKNTKDDIDIEIYSLHYYLKLLSRGDTGALDMLHAPIDNKNIVLHSTDIWKCLNVNRSEFYTTNLSAFVGYCRKQASKYGIKGSRLNACKKVMDFLKDKDGKLSDYEFPKGEHIHHIKADEDLKIPFDMYQVVGKKFQVTVQCSYAYNALEKFYSEYGKRAKLAAKNEGVDWKAVSHALRCAFEMNEIYGNGDMKFPLYHAEYLLRVKQGKVDYKEVGAYIEELMDKIETMATLSTYPKKVDMEVWHKWLIRIYSSGGKELYL